MLGTGLWAATFTLLGYFISENINEATELASRGMFVFGAVVAAGRRDRARGPLPARAPRTGAGWRGGWSAIPALRPLVALGRRIEPQARFLWHRVTPGGLGLEFTTLMAALAVALFVLIGFAIVDLRRSRADAGRHRGDRPGRADLRADWLTDIAKVVTALGSPR